MRILACLLCLAALSACSASRPHRVRLTAEEAGGAAADFDRGMKLLITRRGRLHRPQQAFPWLLKAAQAGYPQAQAVLGSCLLRGWGVKADRAAARVWYERAAGSGLSGAAMELAMMAWEERDARATEQWLEKALAKGRGRPEAQLLLASFHIRGKRWRPAVRHLRYAALAGSGMGAYMMHQCYTRGLGVPRDAGLALGWLRSAAELRFKPAVLRLKTGAPPPGAPSLEGMAAAFLAPRVQNKPQN